MHREAVQFVFLLQLLGNLLFENYPNFIETFLAMCFKRSQAHLAQAHLELSDAVREAGMVPKARGQSRRFYVSFVWGQRIVLVGNDNSSWLMTTNRLS